ncbi:MAG: AAA family ATPase [Sphingomonadaceae bacterium]
MHSLDNGSEALAFLEQWAAAADASSFERIDTHAATVLLWGDRAWKLKRPVRYAYLDFSTPKRRHTALEAELLLNRRTAPALYLTLRSVNRDARGTLTIDGPGAPIEWFLEMRRFADDALLAHLAERGSIAPTLLMRLADKIQTFHDQAAVVVSGDVASRMRQIIDGNEPSLKAFPAILDPVAAHALICQQRQLVTKHHALLDARFRAGRVRHCHGDLHLANIAIIDGEATPFDCLEFSEELASIDVLYDLAFLLMDLCGRGLRLEASLVFNRYIDLSPADEAAGVIMPLFLSVRATIRAHVAAAATAIMAEGTDPPTLLRLAEQALQANSPMLVAVGGRSGSGKSSVARLLGDMGPMPGARVLRSDVLRKRLAGVPPEARLPADSYTPASSAAVYAYLVETARATIESGQWAIVDAVFETQAERTAIESAAHSAGVPFCGIWLDAPEGLRIERVEKRTADASDADAAVAKAQSSRSPGDLGTWHILPADRPLQATAEAAKSLILSARSSFDSESHLGCG